MVSEGFTERYINPYTDFGFKKIFGTNLNKELLVSFLNALLEGKEVIEDVSYLNTEHIGTQEYDRRAIFDVYCVNDKGERFIVEMQRGEQQFFKDRSIYYSSFAIREQAPKGEWDYELKAVYAICILNFEFYHRNEDVCQFIKLMNVKTNEVFYDKLTFIYLEMPKFDKQEDQLVTMLDKWMFVLKNLSKLLIRPAALQEKVFTTLFKTAEIARYDRKTRLAYEDSLKNYRDWYSTIKTAENKGEIRGIEKGRKEGIREGRELGMKEGRVQGMKEGEKKAQEKLIAQMKELGYSEEDIERIIKG